MGTKQKKATLGTLIRMKSGNEKVTAITSYDCQMARLAEQAGVDWILVGDSAGNNVLGYKDTRPVTMDEMMMLSRAVRRGAPNTLVVGDMPLGSYQASDERAVDNALRFIKEAEMDAVKCEGGRRMAERVEAMANAGIAVMGHIGYTPQSTNLVGIVQGNSSQRFEELLNDAHALQDAGTFAILLEAVPNEPAGFVAREMKIPIYGIGAGREVDGVLAIAHDVTGLGTFECKFVRRFCEAGALIERGIKDYVEAVRTGKFPGDEHLYSIKPQELDEIRAYVKEHLKPDKAPERG